MLDHSARARISVGRAGPRAPASVGRGEPGSAQTRYAMGSSRRWDRAHLPGRSGSQRQQSSATHAARPPSREQVARDMQTLHWTTTTAPPCCGVVGASNSLTRSVTPVLGLTRRGDLKSKLRAFDLGVDDILTMPFAPEELLARCIVITRRAFGTDRPIVPTITLGEMVIDIVNREVRAGRSVVHLSGHRAEPALPARQPCRPGRDQGGDPGRHLGYRLRGREQHRGSPRPEPPHQAPERLSASALHQYMRSTRLGGTWTNGRCGPGWSARRPWRSAVERRLQRQDPVARGR